MIKNLGKVGLETHMMGQEPRYSRPRASAFAIYAEALFEIVRNYVIGLGGVKPSSRSLY